MYKIRFIIIALLFNICLVSAIDPVTVSVNLTPPYTPFLNEYSSEGINKLQVTLMVNDSRLNNYPVKLQMFVEQMGYGIVMKTNTMAMSPIFISGNVTEVLNGADLSRYFMAQNNTFSGFSQSQYLQTGRIPDGHYRIGFRVVDAQRTEVQFSNTAYTQPGWFVLNDPPQLNQPRNNSTYRVVEPQSVMLEWFPRHLGGMNSSFAVSYQVELFTIRVPNMDPNQVALSLQPDYTETVTQNRVYITTDKFLFEPGVKYAWRVKAQSSGDQITLFQNTGYSEVYSFDYGALCSEPKNVKSTGVSVSDATIEWDTDPMHTVYEMRFRKQGDERNEWYTRESFTNKAEVKGLLEPATYYEYQVKAKCNTVSSEYSPVKRFRTPLPPTGKYECGKHDTIQVANTTPKDALNTGQIIYNGKFPVRLTEVSGGNGTFSGTGKMRIPYLLNAQVNMKFENVRVNELNEVIEGTFVSIYNPDSRFLIGDVTDYFNEGDQIGNIIDGVDSAAITLAYAVSSGTTLEVKVSGNTVTVSAGGSSTTTTVENMGEGTTIQDSKGNLYAVDADGIVTEVGKSGT
ncbi:MAG: hypothetical protein MI922_27425, partial [Bacteroidales bacterium]|nr:hypothetical protein [Bacteroidales bacterium]